jgi:hypothetical protein
MENKEKPSFISTLLDKGLEGIDSLIDKTDEQHSSNPIYQSGQKIGSWLNDLIDKFADFVTTEQKK